MLDFSSKYKIIMYFPLDISHFVFFCCSSGWTNANNKNINKKWGGKLSVTMKRSNGKHHRKCVPTKRKMKYNQIQTNNNKKILCIDTMAINKEQMINYVHSSISVKICFHRIHITYIHVCIFMIYTGIVRVDKNV